MISINTYRYNRTLLYNMYIAYHIQSNLERGGVSTKEISTIFSLLAKKMTLSFGEKVSSLGRITDTIAQIARSEESHSLSGTEQRYQKKKERRERKETFHVYAFRLHHESSVRSISEGYCQD